MIWSSIFILKRNLHAVFHETVSFIFPPSVHKGCLFFTSLPALIICYLFWWQPFWQMWGSTSLWFWFAFSLLVMWWKTCFHVPVGHLVALGFFLFNAEWYEFFAYFLILSHYWIHWIYHLQNLTLCENPFPFCWKIPSLCKSFWVLM